MRTFLGPEVNDRARQGRAGRAFAGPLDLAPFRPAPAPLPPTLGNPAGFALADFRGAGNFDLDSADVNAWHLTESGWGCLWDSEKR